MPLNDDAEGLLALLSEPYQLDPGGIATLAELTLQLLPTVQERVIFAALDRYRTPGARLALTRYLQALVELRPDLAGILKRAIKRRGRCPAAARPIVRDALGIAAPSHPTAVSDVTVATPASVHGSVADLPESITPVELLLDPTTTMFDALPHLFDRIAAAEQKGSHLMVRVREFVYASGLAIVATWANAKATYRAVRPEDYSTANYLQRIGFHEALRGEEQGVGGDPEDWSVRLTVITENSRVQDVTAKILDILDTFVNPSKEDRSSFGILLGELIENVSRHAEAKSPGFVVAQVYPRKYKLGITIADSGIGIKTSFLEGEVAEYRDPEKPDAHFIRLALQPLVTSKVSRHSGYGLYILAELLRRNGGTFGVTSGTNTLVGYRVAGKNRERIYAHAPWQGTVVTMIVDLQKQLPLGDVYRSLPMPEGFDVSDFFA